MKYADLHTHTKFSDGTFSPEELVRRAKEKGLSCIAVTDHDEVSAIAPAMEEGRKLGIEIIPGVELTAEIDEYEIHILGYFIDWRAEWFREKLKQIREVRKKRALAIIEKLRDYGVELDAAELLRNVPKGAIGRLHIARMLQEKGYVSSVPEAFDKYIANDRPCYVKKFKLTPEEAIGMVKKLKGIPVLAHPYSIGNDELIVKFVQAGLKGIEAYFSEDSKNSGEHYRALAAKHGLLVTGGSDCHGLGKDRVLLGEARVPYAVVEKLKKEAEALKGEH